MMDPGYLEGGSSEVEDEAEERQEDDGDDKVNISNNGNDSEDTQCPMVHNHSLRMSQIPDSDSQDDREEADTDPEESEDVQKRIAIRNLTTRRTLTTDSRVTILMKMSFL